MSNKVATTPHYDMLQTFKSEIFKALRVCLPGKIAAIDAATGTVSVTIGIMQRVAKQGFPKGLDVTYPQLTHCPIYTVQGGGVGAVMSVKVGDECLVVFADRCVDTWFSTGVANPLPSVRMHDISDGFVLVGLNSTPNPLLTPLLTGEGGICETQDLTGAKIVIDPATHKISLSTGVVNLFTALTALNTTLTTLIGVIGTLTTTGGPTTQTVSAATVAALIPVTTALANVQTQLAALLY